MKTTWLGDFSNKDAGVDEMLTPDKIQLYAKKPTFQRTIFVEYARPACVPQVEIRNHSVRDKSFDNSDLAQLLSFHRKAVILAISKHMHLCLVAKAILESLAKKNKFELVVLSDPDNPLSGFLKLE